MMQNKTMQYTESELETISPIMGQIVAYTDKNIPEGWLACHGRMLRRHDYPELFKVISTIYGDGDGSNTAFNLPNIVDSEPDVRHIIFVGIVN